MTSLVRHDLPGSSADSLVGLAAAPQCDEAPAEETTDLPVDHAGTSVHVRILRRPGTALPPILLVHDVTESSERYEAAAQEFRRRGHSVYRFDLRGHGRSGRQLGHAPSFAALVRDLLQVAAWSRYEEQGRTPVLIGQGIGALIVREFVKEHANFCRAAVLSAPCIGLSASITMVRRALIKLLADVAPLMRVPRLLRPRFIIRESPSAARFPGLTAQLTQELLLAMKRAQQQFMESKTATLVLCPDKDLVCNYQQVKKVAATHDEHNLTILDLPGSPHGIFTTDAANLVSAVDKILAWLNHTGSNNCGRPVGEAVSDAPAAALAANDSAVGIIPA